MITPSQIALSRRILIAVGAASLIGSYDVRYAYSDPPSTPPPNVCPPTTSTSTTTSTAGDCPSTPTTCSDGEVAYNPNATINGGSGSPPVFLKGSTITATINYSSGACCGTEPAPQGYQNNLTGNVTPATVGAHQTGTTSATGACGNQVTASTGPYTIVDAWFEDEFGGKVTSLNVVDGSTAPVRVCVNPSNYTAINLKTNGSTTVTGGPVGQIDVGATTGGGSIDAEIYSGGPIANTLTVNAVPTAVRIKHEPDHGEGPLVIINNTGNYDGYFWADETGSDWWVIHEPSYWKQTGVNSEYDAIPTVWDDFDPAITNVGGNQLEVFYTVNSSGGTVSDSISFTTSNEIVSLTASPNPAIKEQKRHLGEFWGNSTTETMTVIIEMTGSVTSAWDDSKTTSINIETQTTAQHEITASGTASVKALELTSGQNFSISNSLTTAVSASRTTQVSGSTVNSLNATTNPIAIPVGKKLYLWYVLVAAEQEITAEFYEDANVDGIADGPLRTAKWLARDSAATGKEFVVQ